LSRWRLLAHARDKEYGVSERDKTPVSVPAEIAAYYAQGGETDRLFKGRGRLELDRTQAILRRHLPPPPAVVLDVGGATGVYARWLADLGHEVHLVDPVATHVDAARLASERHRTRPLASVSLGDARRLRRPADSADMVLLMGPLYHLTRRADRLQALREARRVLRGGGLVCAVGISRYAPLLDGLFGGLLADPAYAHIVDRGLIDGEHRDPTESGYFTTAYLHRPEELEGEVRAAGFNVEAIVAIEGVAAWLPDFDEWWDDPQRRAWLLAAIQLAEADRSLLGASSHLLVVGRKRRGGPPRPRRPRASAG
jgi:SAM-dependent methyltransferase